MLAGYGLYQEEHEAFRRTVRAVIEKEILPFAKEWEAREEFPRELFLRFGELGFLGLKYPVEYGGSAAGELYEAVLLEELSRCGSGGVSAGLGAQFTISTGPLHLFGTDAFGRAAESGARAGGQGGCRPPGRRRDHRRGSARSATQPAAVLHAAALRGG